MPSELTVLGRGVVVGPGAGPPAGYARAPVVRIDDSVLAAPTETVTRLHQWWLGRVPVVVELAVAASTLREPEGDAREPWELGDRRELTRERLHFLVWANTWDARSGEPVWWWGRKAARLGARTGGPADVLLPDGTPALIDGGPRGTLDPGAVPAGIVVVHRESVEAGVLAVARSRPPNAELAIDQLAAVTHRGGAARVIAPAGSGKTRVLTERLRHMLDDEGWEASSVTAVAFNKRAADELISRTTGLRPHVRTINALGLAVLNGALGGPQPARRPAVIDEAEVRRILDGLVDVQRQANNDALAPYLEGLAAIRIGLRDPAKVEAELPDAKDLTTVWPAYRDALDRAGAVDFDDQVERAIRVLLTEPDVRAAVQRRCRHLLVDEFQDLAPAHLLLLRLVAAPAYDVFGVGDDDQVIYGYAGATPSYLINFDSWFPGAAHHALEVNYRCPVAVVDGARNLLSYNHRRIDKVIRTPPSAPTGRLDVRRVRSETMAAMAVADIRAALDDGSPPDDLAVLARVNSALLPVQIALQVAAIPTNRPLDRRMLARTGVRTALAWLRLGSDRDSIARTDVQETVRRPSRRISRNVVEMVIKPSRTSVTEIRRLARRLSGGDVEKLTGYADDIDAVAAAVPKGTAAALAAIRTTVALGQAMDTLDASRAEADRSSHGDDLRALEQIAALHPDAATFADWLSEHLASRAPTPQPHVTLSTVHRVKGQEWPMVIVFGVHDEAFPHRLATDMEEERRVFHVAVTRAAGAAVILADEAAPSPFLAELDGTRPREALRGRGAQLPAATLNPAGGGVAGGARGGPAGPARPGAARAVAARHGRAAGPASSLPTPGTSRPDSQPGAVAPRAATSSLVDPELWEALRGWRRQTAARSGIAAYQVLSDADLQGVAEQLPTTLVELRRCRGLGPMKLERYGDELLALLDAVTGR